MNTSINKDFLVNYRFSDNSTGWTLQAKGFYYSAKMLIKESRETYGGKRLISTEEIFLYNSSVRIACYLQAHAIELSLKAIYCATKTPQDKPVEKYSHKIDELLRTLKEKNILSFDDSLFEIIKIALMLLKWYGKYHKPHSKDLEKTINELFEPDPNRANMLRLKYSIDYNFYTKLENFTNALISKLPDANPAHVGHIIFDTI